LTVGEIKKYREVIQNITVDPKLLEYIASIIVDTRNNSSLYLGASTRASLALLKAAKATAALRGRDFIIPEDIQQMAPHVLRHRIMLSPEKEMEGIMPDQLIENILKSIEVPR
jgi:MoxR-like ATPase